MYKKFFVSKSDVAKKEFVTNTINEVNPDNVYILVEESRKWVYKDVEAVKMPLSKINKTAEWINFSNNFTQNSLLVIDNMLKFIFFGDGKSKHLRMISQSIDNIIVTDVVPFYTEPAEIYYPFYFLDKSIIGYNNFNSFQSNHMEEKKDGTLDNAHSFEVLKEKIEGYYIQDYNKFFPNKEEVWWEMNELELKDYEAEKQKTTNEMDNPIAIFNKMSNKINLIPSKFARLNELTKDGRVYNVFINASGRFPALIKKHLENENVFFHSFHDKDLSKVPTLENIVFLETPIVKAHKLFYIDALVKQNQKCYIFRTDNNLEKYFYNRVFNSELRNEFDKTFGA